MQHWLRLGREDRLQQAFDYATESSGDCRRRRQAIALQRCTPAEELMLQHSSNAAAGQVCLLLLHEFDQQGDATTGLAAACCTGACCSRASRCFLAGCAPATAGRLWCFTDHLYSHLLLISCLTLQPHKCLNKRIPGCRL